MGQQQLLLVILVTIIVGIATVVAINVFGTSAASANEDAVRQDILTIASAAQGYFIKPEMMGGGGNTFNNITFQDFNFSAESISSNGLSAVNMNGKYVISEPATAPNSGDPALQVTAHPASDDNYDASQGLSATASETMEAYVTQGGIEWGT